MNRAVLIAVTLAIASAPSFALAASHGHAHDDNSTHGHGHWAAPAHAQSTPNPMQVDAASLEIGAALYQENCAACHGADGRGNGAAAASLEAAPADLAQMAPTHADGDLAWKIENGRGEMPGWAGVLSSTDIWHVVNYLRNLPRLASISSGGHGDNGHGHDNGGHSHGPNARPHVD